MNEAFKAVATEGAGLGDVAASLLLLSVLALAAMVLGARSYNRMLDAERTA